MFKRCTVFALSLVFALNLACGYARDNAKSEEKPAVHPGRAAAFLVKPYLQLGNAPTLSGTDSAALLWQTDDTESKWEVEYKSGSAASWSHADAPSVRRVVIPGTEPHRLYQTTLTKLTPGTSYTYRVLQNGTPTFEATGHARKPASEPFRAVIFGDCAADTAGQRAIAYQTYQLKPDFVFITGDIVYTRGKIAEYRTNFFPIYNADEASPSTGAPLTRSTVFLAAPGNHDILHANLDEDADKLAYFYYWAQPLNGPITDRNAPNTPKLEGDAKLQEAFLNVAGTNYPRMANFSFDYGNAHWTVLDSNPHADWRTPELRAWIEKDIAAAKNATWHFVAFHHPGFNSSEKHFDEQHMRVLADLFEKNGVDVVFSGHVHNYQRTFPMTFKMKADATEKKSNKSNHVDGDWTLDKTFDGKTNTKPKGVIYIITGGGGAKLYDPQQQNKPETWQSFTEKFISDTHSLTLLDVKGKELSLRQISKDGKELDHITVTK